MVSPNRSLVWENSELKKTAHTRKICIRILAQHRCFQPLATFLFHSLNGVSQSKSRLGKFGAEKNSTQEICIRILAQHRCFQPLATFLFDPLSGVSQSKSRLGKKKRARRRRRKNRSLVWENSELKKTAHAKSASGFWPNIAVSSIWLLSSLIL